MIKLNIQLFGGGNNLEDRNWRKYVNDARGPFKADGLTYNNVGAQGSDDGMDLMWNFYLDNKKLPTKAEYVDMGGNGAAYDNVYGDFERVVIPAFQAHADYNDGDWEANGIKSEPNWNYNVDGTKANWNLTEREKQTLLRALNEKGRPLTDSELLALGLINKGGNAVGTARFDNLKEAQTSLITNNAHLLGFNSSGAKINPDGSVNANAMSPEEIKEKAFNQYYKDIFSQEEGTTGRRILDNNVSLYQKEAKNAEILANTGLQAQAMTQAQAVKQVTDSVRSERMAQLRAGMSEAQLADRELQMLMGSVNQMSQQAQISSQEATAAQLASSTARENAFNDYITQATALGQNAAANYASEVGDAYALAAKIKRDADASGQAITWEEAQRRAMNAPQG